jgi:uncharacterized membrane protein HdeD (DUF308 family)
MRIALATNWWSLVIRGIAGIALGILTFVWPGITLVALVLLFGAYSLIDGVMSLIGAVRAAEAHERWGVLVLEGLVGIATAAITVLWPGITAIALVYVIAAWALITGALEIGAAIRLRKVISGEWLLIVGGIASILFGFLLIMAPVIGAVVVALWVGAYTFIFGVLLVALGFKLRSWGHDFTAGGALPLPAH